MDVLVALVAAAESKTKAEAAGKLNLTISALDKRFRLASSLYGAPLVCQNDNGIRLTEEGQIFYAAAARSVEFASLAEQNTRSHLLLKTQHILIGHSSYLAPEILGLVHGLKFDDRPRIRVVHRAGLTEAMARSVREGEMIAGFGFLPFASSELVIRKIWDEPLVACIPSTYPAASRSVIRPEDLDGQPFITIGLDPLPGLHKLIEDLLGSLGVTLKVVADAFAHAEALHLVEQRVGICLLSRSSALPRQGVVVRPLWTSALRRETALFYRDDNHSPLLDELNKIILERASLLRGGRARRIV